MLSSKSAQSTLDPTTELITLVKSGNFDVEMLSTLIENGANVPSIPIYLVGIPDNVNKFIFAKMLIENGANVNIPDPRYNATPLHMAVAKKTYLDMTAEQKLQYDISVDFTELLIKNGANINAQRPRTTRIPHMYEGATPLILACLYYNIDAMTMLIRNGADPNIPMNDGRTAITILDRRKPGLYKDIEEEVKIIAGDHMLFDRYRIFLDRDTIEDMAKYGGKRKTSKKQKKQRRRKTKMQKLRK